jgi:hypothetical protein
MDIKEDNVLDGKVIPHGSYGINHTKHNLEYGYLIVGLMQPRKKRTITTISKEKGHKRHRISNNTNLAQ